MPQTAWKRSASRPTTHGEAKSFRTVRVYPEFAGLLAESQVKFAGEIASTLLRDISFLSGGEQPPSLKKTAVFLLSKETITGDELKAIVAARHGGARLGSDAATIASASR